MANQDPKILYLDQSGQTIIEHTVHNARDSAFVSHGMEKPVQTAIGSISRLNKALERGDIELNIPTQDLIKSIKTLRLEGFGPAPIDVHGKQARAMITDGCRGEGAFGGIILQPQLDALRRNWPRFTNRDESLIVSTLGVVSENGESFVYDATVTPEPLSAPHRVLGGLLRMARYAGMSRSITAETEGYDVPSRLWVEFTLGAHSVTGEDLLKSYDRVKPGLSEETLSLFERHFPQFSVTRTKRGSVRAPSRVDDSFALSDPMMYRNDGFSG